MPKKLKVKSDNKILPIEEIVDIKGKGIINHNPYFPDKCFKCLMIAPSESGKTTLVFNIIDQGFIDYDTVNIFASQSDDDDYEGLEQLFQDLADKANIPRLEFPAHIYQKLDNLFGTGEIPPLIDTLTKDKKHLVIIDDFSSDTRLGASAFKNFLDVCRHKNIQVIVIFHTFKHSNVLIRERFKQLCLFNGCCDGVKDIDYMGEKLGLGLTKEEFRDVFNEATKEKYSFLYIDKMEKNIKKKYRNGFFKQLECLKNKSEDKFEFPERKDKKPTKKEKKEKEEKEDDE